MTARLLRMASDRVMRSPDASAAAEPRRSRPRPTGEPYPTTRARAKPRIARTTNTSIRVKPDAGAPRHFVASAPSVSSHGEVIEAEHCGQERADDAGDDKPHDDGDGRNSEGDNPLDHQTRLLVVNVRGLPWHPAPPLRRPPPPPGCQAHPGRWLEPR